MLSLTVLVICLLCNTEVGKSNSAAGVILNLSAYENQQVMKMLKLFTAFRHW